MPRQVVAQYGIVGTSVEGDDRAAVKEKVVDKEPGDERPADPRAW
jgi:hypothetical protein